MIPNIDYIINHPEIKHFFDALKTTPQTKEYHGEGSAFIHSMMVIDEGKKLLSGLSEDEKDVYLMSCLLHDIGKPIASKVEEDGHVSARSHAKIGSHIALEILDILGYPFEKKIQIVNLVLLHGKPQHILEKEDPERIVIETSMDVSNKLLFLLAEADARGRICNDLDELLLNIEFYKETAINLGCFDKPYNFSSDIAKFNYLVKRTHHFTDQPFNDTKSKVYIMSGLMGSGKDYYINKNLKDIPVISLDQIRIEMKIKHDDEQGIVIQTAKERAKEFLRAGKDFVWNATNITKDMRSRLIDVFLPYNPYITIISLQKPLKTVLEQNKNRDAAIPENVVLKSYHKMEIPSKKEAHQVIYIF